MPQRLIHIPLQFMRGVLEETQLSLGRGHEGRQAAACARSAALFGEAMLDRTFTLLTSALSGAPPDHVLSEAVREAEAARTLFESKGWLDDPQAYHLEPPPLDAGNVAIEDSWTLDRGGRRPFRHLRFESGFVPHEEQPGRADWMARDLNATAHAYVLEHPEPRPWLVCLHGFSTGSAMINFASFQAAWLHEELGLNLVFPLLPLHGPRSGSRVSGADVLEPDYMRMVHLFAHSVWDVRRVTSWVQARSDLPIGLYGISLGAYVAALTASLQPGLDCVIAGLPAVDFAGLARDNQPWFMRRYGGKQGFDWELIRDVTRPVSPLALAPQVAHDRRFIFAGKVDRVVRPDQPRALWRHWGEPDIRWLDSGHVLGFRNSGVAPYVEQSLRRAELTP